MLIRSSKDTGVEREYVFMCVRDCIVFYFFFKKNKMMSAMAKKTSRPFSKTVKKKRKGKQVGLKILRSSPRER